jgi:hypothetical protein
MKLLKILALIAFSSSLAEAAPAKMDLAVKFDHSFYDLKYDGSTFSYKDQIQNYAIKTKACNRAKLSRLSAEFHSLLKAYETKPFKKTKFDVELISQRKSLHIARGSALGTWLRDIPAKMPYFNAEANVTCKR